MHDRRIMVLLVLGGREIDDTFFLRTFFNAGLAEPETLCFRSLGVTRQEHSLRSSSESENWLDELSAA